MTTSATTVLALELLLCVSVLSGLSTDCFVFVSSGKKLKEDFVHRVSSVKNVHECQDLCQTSFVSCNSFTYIFNPDDTEKENCFLSREDSNLVNLNNLKHFEAEPKAEHYERGRVKLDGTCQERRPVLPFLDRGNSFTSDFNKQYRYNCFRLVKRGVRIAAKYIRLSFKVKDIQECEWECSRARTFTCRGFNYRYKTYGSYHYRDNCELSEQDTYGSDLSNRYDFYEDENFDFHERTNFGADCDGYGREEGNGYGGGQGYGSCYKKIETGMRIDSRGVREYISAKDRNQCEEECDRVRMFSCKTFSYRFDSRYSHDNCLLSDLDERQLSRHYLIPDISFDVYAKDSYCHGSEPDVAADTREEEYGRNSMTVSGLECARSYCSVDKQGRYYFCYTDEKDAWDYCCRPDSQCSYSQNSKVKWCYVGSEGHDQWRPCVTDSGYRRSYLLDTPIAEAMLADPNATGDFPQPLFTNFTDVHLKDLFPSNK